MPIDEMITKLTQLRDLGVGRVYVQFESDGKRLLEPLDVEPDQDGDAIIWADKITY